MTVEESYTWCRKVARSRARNFYYAFLLLDGPRRDAMCAVYAFMRQCDDLADDRRDRAALEEWRRQLDRALGGHYDPHPAWPALHDAVRRYAIPTRYLHETIEGVMSDLEPRSLPTFDDLYRYCYLVASAVGLIIIHIFGFESAEAVPLAEKCGVAFQLTNILRDVREDAENGRVYLPGEDLERFGVTPAGLKQTAPSAAFLRLMEFEAGRARRYYEESAPLVDLVARPSRPALRALIGIYRRLLERIERSGYDVLRGRVRVPAWEKAAILVRARLSA